MEARQRAKLSLTNRSFGLIVLIRPCPRKEAGRAAGAAPKRPGPEKRSERRKGAPSARKTRVTRMRSAGLVAQAKAPHPIPFRTRP